MHTDTILAFDNIDRLENTLSGGGTSHRINGIAVQHEVYGPHPEPIAVPRVEKSKQRSLAPAETPLSIFIIWQGSLQVNPRVLIGSSLVEVLPYRPFPWNRS